MIESIENKKISGEKPIIMTTKTYYRSSDGAIVNSRQETHQPLEGNFESVTVKIVRLE
jgi:hypothetical protein